MYSSGYFPGVRLWFADVSEPSIGSETSTNHNRTPGKYPKEYIQGYNVTFFTTNCKRMPKTWAFLCRLSNFGGILTIFDSGSAHWPHFVLKRAASKDTHNDCGWEHLNEVHQEVAYVSRKSDSDPYWSQFCTTFMGATSTFTNTYTHLIYRKEETWSRHDTLEIKLQAQLQSTCVPLCISKARIKFKIICGKTFGHCALNYTNETVL